MFLRGPLRCLPFFACVFQQAQLKASLAKHGDIRIHMFVPGTEYGSGWAWVTCEKHEDVEKMLAYAEERKQQAAATLRESMKKNLDEQKEESLAAAETSADEAKSDDCSGQLSDA